MISPWLVHRLLKIPEALQGETLRSFYLLAISVPVVIVAAGLRGLVEAHQRFDLVAYLRIPMGVFGFVGPFLVLPFSRSLVPVVGILVLGRFAGCAAFFWLCLRVAPELRRRVAWHGPSAVPLLRFGGWMTVTNIVGPLMVSLDRFVIARLISVTAVAYYATPYEVVTKLWIIPSALLGVMFPAFFHKFRARPQSYGFPLWAECQVYFPGDISNRPVRCGPGTERAKTLAWRQICQKPHSRPSIAGGRSIR